MIGFRAGPYFSGHLPALMADVRSFDEGELVARTAVLPCAPYLSLDQHQELLTAWTDHGQCWGRAMPAILVELFRATAHLGDARLPAWRALLASIEQDVAAYAAIAGGIGEPTQVPGTAA